MHRVNTATAFVKANMPLGQDDTLSWQQASDVAVYINSHERLAGLRFSGEVAETRKRFHDHTCFYAKTMWDRNLALSSAGE